MIQRVAGHVGHLGVARQRQAETRATSREEKPRPRTRSSGSSDSVCVVNGRAWTTKRPSLNASAMRCLPLRASGRPNRRILRHGPAGDRPDELLLGRQIAVLVHDLQGLVDHRRAVALHDVAARSV